MLGLRKLFFGRVASLFFCSQKKIQTQCQSGTQYSNWVLTRAAGHNHSISHLKRKMAKDRFSIHRLTNLQFMKDLITFGYKYNLTMNQKIILLAQFNHVIEVLGKRRFIYNPILGQLIGQISAEMQDPPDLICLGTFMSSLVTMELYFPDSWLQVVDQILANKFDEEYDELFGIIICLAKYRNQILSTNNYLIISKDPVIPQIPIIYRNSLNVLRQFVTQNIYNLKQCRILFEALYQVNINQSYFWDSVRDWFNIYTKEQLGKKQMDQYFIMKQSAVDRILHDHGIIRPRPILQQLCSIVYVLSQFGNISWRYVQFAQDLILYSIENGSELYKKFLQIQAQQLSQIQEPLTMNVHMKTINQSQSSNIKQMEKRYRTIFINPIALKNNFIVYFLVVLSRAYKKYKQTKIKQTQQKQKQRQFQKDGKRNFYDSSQEVYLDPRVKKWLLIQLAKSEMQYTVKQILTIQKCKEFFKDSQIDIQTFISEKLENLRQTKASYQQISQLMDLLHPIQYNKMNQIFTDFLQRNHPSQILKFTKLLQTQHLFPYMSEYMLRLPRAVNSHQKYYSFQQNCYFMLMLLQNAQSTNSVTNKPILKKQYEGQMEQLKQSIKIITYSRGFKLAVNSYFHKIMDYIDVVQFFQGGRS